MLVAAIASGFLSFALRGQSRQAPQPAGHQEQSAKPVPNTNNPHKTSRAPLEHARRLIYRAARPRPRPPWAAACSRGAGSGALGDDQSTDTLAMEDRQAAPSTSDRYSHVAEALASSAPCVPRSANIAWAPDLCREARIQARRKRIQERLHALRQGDATGRLGLGVLVVSPGWCPSSISTFLRRCLHRATQAARMASRRKKSAKASSKS